jgi:type IX secretion system PorP/SprF family membrane protein
MTIMKRNLIITCIAVTAFIMHQQSFAQDLHFSQYFNSPLLVNPANTGFTPDGDYRVGINYRTQWASISNNPYKTISAYGDVQLFGNRFENGWLGVGGAILRDVAGAGNLTSTKAYASIAYHQALGLGSLVSAGFTVGRVSKRVDFTKLTFDNQWNGKFFDIAAPSGETFATNGIGYYSLGAGMNYAYFPNENTYLNVGFSAMNINRPKETFFSTEAVDARVLPRFTTFVNGSFKTADIWILNPNIYVSNMGTAWEVVAGMNAQRDLSGDGNTQLILGAYYRVKDAIIPMVGFQQNGYKLTFNYDATTSSLKQFNNTRGAYEISIVKQGLLDQTRGIKCPAVRF